MARQHDIPLIDNMGTAQEIVNFEDKWNNIKYLVSVCKKPTGDFGPIISGNFQSAFRRVLLEYLARNILAIADWICQPLLNIQKNYEFISFGEVIKTAAVVE